MAMYGYQSAVVVLNVTVLLQQRCF